MSLLRVSLAGILVLVIGWLAMAKSLAADLVQIQGYLVDRQCAESVWNSSDPLSFVRSHIKDCALMPNCIQEGYVLFANSKWYYLSKHGNELAVKVLKASKKQRGFYVQVSGELQNDRLQVQSIKELEEPKTGNGIEKMHNGHH